MLETLQSQTLKTLIPLGPCPARLFRRQSWLGWSVSSVAGYLGYVPGADAPPGRLAPPSEADIQELYAELGFNPQRPDAEDARAAGASSASVTLDLNVRTAPSHARSPRQLWRPGPQEGGLAKQRPSAVRLQMPGVGDTKRAGNSSVHALTGRDCN